MTVLHEANIPDLVRNRRATAAITPCRLYVIRDITDEFEGYGYRRVDAELHHRVFEVNAKKVRRLMKENDLNPQRRRRFVRITHSDHDSPIFPFVAREFEFHGPDQLWVADLTYITITGGFA